MLYSCTAHMAAVGVKGLIYLGDHGESDEVRQKAGYENDKLLVASEQPWPLVDDRRYESFQCAELPQNKPRHKQLNQTGVARRWLPKMIFAVFGL